MGPGASTFTPRPLNHISRQYVCFLLRKTKGGSFIGIRDLLKSKTDY